MFNILYRDRERERERLTNLFENYFLYNLVKNKKFKNSIAYFE